MNLIQLLFKVAHSGFPCIRVGNVKEHILTVDYPILFKAVLFKAFRNKVFFCYLHLFGIDVAGKLYYLSPIQKRSGNGIEGVCRENKNYVGKVKGQIQIVVPKVYILLGV